MDHIVFCPINNRHVNKLEFCGFKECGACNETPRKFVVEPGHLIKTPRNRKKVLQHASSYEEHGMVLRLYANIVRRYNKDIALDSRERAVANIIQRDIKNYYSKFQKKYLNACKKGDSKFYKVAVDALRPYCFEEHWFNKGVRSLEGFKKQVHTPSFKDTIDFSGAFNEAVKIEKKLKKKAIIKMSEKDQNRIKRYYRDFPPKAETLFLHSVFILINPFLHKEYLEELAPLEDEIHQELIQFFYDVLQKNPAQPLFV